ncbi:O-antigen ligase family protein [Halobacillus litoralis]|uniref:O-antigen ligase family protein n=1 Tax=Halobacillus litoralis TaxID=45668 RepID=UPI001CD296C8|nr:O-antigen ligase family protein [Halobacillus litoralis]MCA0970978.1 O-antigen ligase family protein [Halobacillus litoralis]
MGIKNILDYMTLGIMTMILIISPFSKGLFFDEQLYIWELLIQLVFLIYLIARTIARKTLDIRAMILFCFPVLYLLSMIDSLSFFATIQEYIRWSTYASFFGTCYLLLLNNNIRKISPTLMTCYFLFIAIFPFLVQWGIIQYEDAIYTGRFSGFFQYPNTYGAIVAAGLIYTIVLKTSTDLSNKTNQLLNICLPLLAGAFLMSESRAATIVLLFIWLTGILLVSNNKLVNYFGLSLLSIVSGMFIYSFSTNLIAFLIVMAVTVLVLFVEDKNNIFEKCNRLVFLKKKNSIAFILIAFLAITTMGAIMYVSGLVPEQLIEKVKSISLESNSVAGRLNIYSLALEMSLISPLIGNGGDAWSILFPSHQNLPFWATETHSFFLDQLLKIGWSGFTIIMILLGCWLFKVSKNQFAFPHVTHLAALLASSVLLMHSMLDFNMRYGSFVMVLLIMILLSINPNSLAEFYINKKWVLLLIPVVTFVAISLFFNIRFYAATTIESDASSKDISLGAAEELYINAIRYNPWNPEYRLKLAEVYVTSYEKEQSEEVKKAAIRNLEKAVSMNPQYHKTLYDTANLYNDLGEKQSSIMYLKRATSLNEFSVQYAYPYIAQNIVYAEENPSNRQSNLEMAVQEYEEQMEHQMEYSSENIPDKVNVMLPSKAHVFAAESYLLLGEIEESKKALSRYEEAQDEQIKARYFALKNILYAEDSEQNENELVNTYISFFNKLVDEVK